MRGRRRQLAWLAVLALFLYGAAPVFARLTGAAPAPLVCLTGETHRCACRPDPHALKDCCCAHGSGKSDCGIGRLPCDAGPEHAGLWTAAHPLPLPTGAALFNPPAIGANTFRALPPAALSLARAPAPPPPRRSLVL